MSISLGTPQGFTPACIEPPHFWEIVAVTDVNPATGQPYGKRTPGKCRNCKQIRMFSSEAIQHTKGDFTVG